MRKPMPLTVIIAVSAAMPVTTLRIIPDCGHFAYLECPAAVQDALTTFLGR